MDYASKPDLSLDELKDLFKQLQPTTANADALRAIHDAVFKADQSLKTLEQTDYVHGLEKDFFEQALYLLEPKMQSNFLGSEHFAQSLAALGAFLAYQLPPDQSSSGPVGLICRYCKEPGHYKADCPKIKELMCYRCFDQGHTQKTCTNESLFASFERK